MDKLKTIAHLESADLTVTGRLVDASNATLYASADSNGSVISCIYKPIAGERPLWDFQSGNLAHREYASYLLSDCLGLDLIPPTILREGPYGIGMVQAWIEMDEDVDLMTFFQKDDSRLRKLALFDAIINNTDRKIGHLLPTKDGHLYACDHGVTFHEEDKLRTVLWQWAGFQFLENEIEILRQALVAMNDSKFMKLLTSNEIEATKKRIMALIRDQVFPQPSEDWPAVPWPPF
ncbi:unannotated protein [freshwater metagenome]|uniref:Unannotated protein n=1 Tax=freshwater metagenome TaxID=449393 RepID=A0A6J7DR30_9ZZZZ|nr:SCO1664 family protein [Actinomycetota bacterium]